MDQRKDWPDAGRVVWLTGGLVAYNNPGPNVEICAGSNGHAVHEFTINSYGHLFEALKRQGFSIIGATFVVHQDELDGLRLAEFRMAGSASGWSLWNVEQQWRQIAFAASKQDNMPLLDISSRIAIGLEYSQLRLYDLAFAYGLQLHGHWHKNQALEYQTFSDLNSRQVYKAIHALFWELAVLRDTLAEFAAMYCFSLGRVKRLSNLTKLLQKNRHADPIAAEILRITDKSLNGWLSRFTSYRNFFTHSAPMESATGIAFTVQDVRKINDALMVPQIYYPLPGNIEDLTRERSHGIFYSSMAALVNALKHRPDRSLDPDALEYLHSCLNSFVELTKTLIAHSPISPAPIRFTAEDIVGEIKWNSAQ
jgi:hypothetical protein